MNAGGSSIGGSARATVTWAVNARRSGGNSEASARRTAPASDGAADRARRRPRPTAPSRDRPDGNAPRPAKADFEAERPTSATRSTRSRTQRHGPSIGRPEEGQGQVQVRRRHPPGARIADHATGCDRRRSIASTAGGGSDAATNSPGCVRLGVPPPMALRRRDRPRAAACPRGIGARGRARPALPIDARAPDRPGPRSRGHAPRRRRRARSTRCPAPHPPCSFGTGRARQRDGHVCAEQAPRPRRHLEGAFAAHHAGSFDRRSRDPEHVLLRLGVVDDRRATKTFDAPSAAVMRAPTPPPVSDSAHASRRLDANSSRATACSSVSSSRLNTTSPRRRCTSVGDRGDHRFGPLDRVGLGREPHLHLAGRRQVREARVRRCREEVGEDLRHPRLADADASHDARPDDGRADRGG